MVAQDVVMTAGTEAQEVASTIMAALEGVLTMEAPAEAITTVARAEEITMEAVMITMAVETTVVTEEADREVNHLQYIYH